MRSESKGRPDRKELLEYLDSSVGSLVPSFVHNLNNRLLGATGNLDLAEMYSGSAEKVSEKIIRARQAVAEVCRFVSDLNRFRSAPGPCTSGTLEDVVGFASLACGRSMSLDSTEVSVFPDNLPLTDLEFRTLLAGMMSWAVTSCEGAGSISLKSNAVEGSVVFTVSRIRVESASAADADYVREPSSWMIGLAGRLGCSLMVDITDDLHGYVSLEIPSPGNSSLTS